jgi:hypothetical protein
VDVFMFVICAYLFASLPPLFLFSILCRWEKEMKGRTHL